jgi:hypothetical protein
MEPRFFSILGLFPTRDHNRSGLNDAQAHRDDEQWTLGEVPDTLVAAFRAPRAGIVTPDARSSSGSRPEMRPLPRLG